ncbi:MAG TPA: S41 family peptidase [Flavobacteriales bacterium]|nr:S41 family peptidase [Flavobacteriales bacterium]
MKKYILYLLAIPTIAVTAIALRAPSTNEFEVTKNFEIFREIYTEIYSGYVDEHAPGDLMKRSIDGMLESLDPYTNYIPESDIEDYRIMTTGQYGGVGALIRKMDDDFNYIMEPYENSPIQKAGFKAGDKILEIDGNALKNKSTDEVSTMLKGAAGTSLKLKVDRAGQTIEKTISREEIKIPDVPYSGMIDNEIGYIKLNSFTQSASSEVKEAFTKLKGKGMKKLIFDLRGNGGGLLNEAVRIVNMFVPQGTMIVKQKGRVPEMNINYQAREEATDANIPLVVLVDDGSASASEIVSGSLQDLDRAVIVGIRSYGKGLVQQTRKMPYNTMVKLTVAKYYTPSGRCIQKLDYTTKRAGDRASAIADSAIHKYKTKNGREVIDARGIDPEILVEEKEFSKLAAIVVAEDLAFNYATAYERKHPSLPGAREFKLTDAEYGEFLAMVKDKDFKYKTTTEARFEEFKKSAQKENYYAGAEGEFDKVYAKIKADKMADFERFKPEIKEIIENEIVSRYYYQNGRTENSFNYDEYLVEAIKVLKDEARYKGILDGTVKK